jgi:DNA-binding beta-propeller fold protein YncE
MLLAATHLCAGEPDRSPVDLVLAPDGSWLATVNQTSHTVSLVRIADGHVLDEQPAGQHPQAIALAPDGQTLLVSSRDDGLVQRLVVRENRLHRGTAIPVGFHPHGLAIAPDGRTAYVACTASAEVAVLDLLTDRVVRRIAVGRWPRHLALTPDGTRLAVGTSGDRGVTVVDCSAGQALYQEQFVGLNIGHLQTSRDGRYVWLPWMVYRANPITPTNIRLGWVLASRVARVRLDGPSRREAMSLDPPGRAIADVHGLALTRDEAWLVVSAAGTHELLVYRTEGLPLKDYGGTDHVDPALAADAQRFARIELGGRPMGVRIGPDDRTAYVANYLDNSVQVVDLASRRLVRRIFLGGPAEPSLARRGEAIFYDARRSLDQWYSCHTCHYEGGSNSVPMDTLNDGSPFTSKTVLPLYAVHETGPWTWHGWQQNFSAALRKSLTETMQGLPPTEEDLTALDAFLRTLEVPPSPWREAAGGLSPAAQRGQAIFESARAGCVQCHCAPHYTDGQIHDVGLSSPRDRYQGFNTPSLRGVYLKVKFLHDGRADTLHEVLTGPHAPDKVAGTSPLTPQELDDLIAYLRSL